MAENHQFCSITPGTPLSSSTATDGVTSLAALTATKTAAHYYVVSEPLSVFPVSAIGQSESGGSASISSRPRRSDARTSGSTDGSESRVGASVLEWAYDDSVCYLHQGQAKRYESRADLAGPRHNAPVILGLALRISDCSEKTWTETIERRLLQPQPPHGPGRLIRR